MDSLTAAPSRTWPNRRTNPDARPGCPPSGAVAVRLTRSAPINGLIEDEPGSSRLCQFTISVGPSQKRDWRVAALRSYRGVSKSEATGESGASKRVGWHEPCTC